MRVIVINQADFKGELAAIKAGLEQGLDQAAAEIKVKMLQPTTAWEHKPEVTIEGSVGTRTISTGDPNYVRVEAGTPPHSILAKNGQRLHFQGSTPKTTPFNFDSGSGGKDGVFHHPKEVNNPGISPRGWTELIEFEYGDFNGGGRLALLVQQAINSK